jgi:hypothetical protein
MMPNNALSSSLVFGLFLPPDDIEASAIVDYEMGGVGISDATEGLLVQVWTANLIGNPGEVGTSVWISAPNTPSTLVFAEDGISEISLTFDQNMHPVIAYFAAGRAKLRWYDATIPGYSIITFPDGAKAPKCTLDDKRPLATLTASSDILVAYIYADDLIMRMQRDRFTIDYTLMVNLSDHIANPSVLKDAMNNVDRVQFMLSGSLYS